jgi:hypothetical protein
MNGLVDERKDEILLCREVAIHRAHADAGQLCDLVHLDVAAALGERLSPGLEDTLMVPAGVRSKWARPA